MGSGHSDCQRDGHSAGRLSVKILFRNDRSFKLCAEELEINLPGTMRLIPTFPNCGTSFLRILDLAGKTIVALSPMSPFCRRTESERGMMCDLEVPNFVNENFCAFCAV